MEPELTGTPVIDALGAAATEQAAATTGQATPAWTSKPVRRSLKPCGAAAPTRLFVHALVHSPLTFSLHGVLVEADSLSSVRGPAGTVPHPER